MMNDDDSGAISGMVGRGNRNTRRKTSPIVKLSTTNPTWVVKLEVFTAVTMKNGVFWDVMPCGSCKNRRFGGA
jgi:hypothetical protein